MNVFADVRGANQAQHYDEEFWDRRKDAESEYNETQLDINAFFDDQNRATKKQLQKKYHEMPDLADKSGKRRGRRKLDDISIQSGMTDIYIAEDDFEPVKTEEDKRREAIIRIQSFWRMYVLSKDYRQVYEAATTI